MLDQQILFFGLPIKLDENTMLYQPTLNEILEKDFHIENILEPFIALDKRNFKNEEKNDKVDNFNILFIQVILGYIQFLTDEPTKTPPSLKEWIESANSDWLIVKKLIRVLKFLCKTEDIILQMSDFSKENENSLNENYILINKSYKINRDTFEDLKDLVCEILDTEINIERNKEEDMDVSELGDLFEQKRKQYEKKYGKKKQKKEKNKDNLTIFTLINYIIHYENTQYDYNSIKQLTIYQIKNTFKYYHSQEMYQLDMKYRTSGNFKMENKTSEHWFFDKN
jgi:hypothetical protein